MKKDARQIKLDPKEWRDAMRGVEAGSRLPSTTGPATGAAKPARTSKPTGKKAKPARAR